MRVSGNARAANLCCGHVACQREVERVVSDALDSQPPECPHHLEVQHRDGRPPWCAACGWRHGLPARRATAAERIR